MYQGNIYVMKMCVRQILVVCISTWEAPYDVSTAVTYDHNRNRDARTQREIAHLYRENPARAKFPWLAKLTVF